jgi:hypothetical protein
MKYILVDFSNSTRKILCVSDESKFEIILAHFRKRFSCREVTKPPSKRTVRRWRKSGRCKALCGCWISCGRGERCQKHNCMSWLTAVYNIKGMYGASA